MARVLAAAFLFLVACPAWGRSLDAEFEKATLKIGNKKITAYVADDDDKRAQGLMFIEKLPENTGMIFVFEEERTLSFWMKDTLIPLSIGFFNAKAVLVDVQEMQVTGSLMSNSAPSYPSKVPAAFALEMNKGWFAKHKISRGARLKLVSNVKSRLLTTRLRTK